MKCDCKEALAVISVSFLTAQLILHQ